MSASEQKRVILSVVGTRPNFMKVGPIEESLKQHSSIEHVILHTGQHFDTNMSEVFFRDLKLRQPDIYLGIAGGLLGDQTGRIMVALEKELLQLKPNLVVVVGDVNSTFASAWVAVQNHIPVAHVEAGLRSFDRRMPEEINRICTDVICELLFTTHPMADEQLAKEGVDSKKIHMVGNIMIDYLVRYQKQAEAMQQWQALSLPAKGYAIVTLHRPSNVDVPEQLKKMVGLLGELSQELPLVFPVHPRTKKNLELFGLLGTLKNNQKISVVEPQSYLNFLSLVLQSRLVLTDSGGLQEETSVLDIPCVTLRENTERPFTVDFGTNYLVGTNSDKVLAVCREILAGNSKTPQDFSKWQWDGRTGERIATHLVEYLRA